MNACAQALRSAGASAVYGLSFARAVLFGPTGPILSYFLIQEEPMTLKVDIYPKNIELTDANQRICQQESIQAGPLFK